jgi:hypothetical protein
MSERQSNIEVEVIDGEKIFAELRDRLTELPKTAKFRFWAGAGIVRTPNGTFLVDTEGCGSSLPIEESPAELEVTRADIMLAGAPWVIKITKEDLDTLPTCGKINLAVFIRTFGPRLENNFNMWNKFLTKAMA